MVGDKLIGDAMRELKDELGPMLDDGQDWNAVKLGDDGPSAYVVTAESRSHAREMTDWDVDAADEAVVIQTSAVDTPYATAFKVEDE